MSVLYIISLVLSFPKEECFNLKIYTEGSKHSGTKKKNRASDLTIQYVHFHSISHFHQDPSPLSQLPSAVSKLLWFHPFQIINIQFFASYVIWRRKMEGLNYSRLSTNPRIFSSTQHSHSQRHVVTNIPEPFWSFVGQFLIFLINFPLCRQRTECRKMKT